MEHKAIVVGCGLSGAVIARHLAEKGEKVEILAVLERSSNG